MSGFGEIALRWVSPGPVSSAFMLSTRGTQILNGPVGSGKTRTVFEKGLRLARQQRPTLKRRELNLTGELVPVREFKLAVIHVTYRQLWRATIPTWNRRMPQDAGEWVGARNAPAQHRIAFELDHGTINSTIVDFQVEFGAIQDIDLEEFMRGYEPTAFYINEMDLAPRELIGFAQGRVGRYPTEEEGGASWCGVLGDCNAPEFENWLFEEVFTKTPAELEAADVALFRQPGGRDPGAENLMNLRAGYYTPKIGQPPWMIARMLDNKSGYSRSGKPVYPEYNDLVHCALEEFEPVKGLAILVGIDPRSLPSAALGQRMADGQLRVFDELVMPHGTGPRRFGRALAKLLHDKYPGFEVRGIADPTAAYGADHEDDEADWMQKCAAAAGIVIVGASTNLPTARWEAVRAPLQTLIEGRPGLTISPRARTLRTGFNNGYRFRKLQLPGATRYAEAAEKNSYSDVHDALQYLALDATEQAEIAARAAEQRRKAAEGQHASTTGDWDPHRAAYDQVGGAGPRGMLLPESDPYRDD